MIPDKKGLEIDACTEKLLWNSCYRAAYFMGVAMAINILGQRRLISSHHLNWWVVAASQSLAGYLTLPVPCEMTYWDSPQLVASYFLFGRGTWLSFEYPYFCFCGSLQTILCCIYVSNSWSLHFSAAQEAGYCITTNKSFPRPNYKSGSVRWIPEFYIILFK